MKKVAILTITNSGLNFGNRLQNYALQEALKSVGADVWTIKSAKSVYGSALISNIRRYIKSAVKSSKRNMLFYRFDQKYIKFDKMIRYETLNEKDFADKYDIFVAGSDQVWNPYFHFNSSFEFASFAPKEKRYSYAASIGADIIDDEKKRELIDNILSMKKISIREKSGVEFVEKNTGIKPFRHVDPTLLLGMEHYHQLEKKPDYQMPQHYLFMYFLGDISEDYLVKVENIAEKKKLQIIRFTENKWEPFYNIGPREFLYLICHADYICTDSLHGILFSMIYKKQLAIFTRQDSGIHMNSRFQTLFELFDLNSRLITNLDDNYYADIDYEYIDRVLSDEKHKAYSYLADLVAQTEN